MIQALLAGVASIKAQQTRMNVIGNNLANVNTTSYKGSRVTFQDMIAQTIRGASRPNANLGGTNHFPSGGDAGLKVTCADRSKRPFHPLGSDVAIPFRDEEEVVVERKVERGLVRHVDAHPGKPSAAELRRPASTEAELQM